MDSLTAAALWLAIAIAVDLVIFTGEGASKIILALRGKSGEDLSKNRLITQLLEEIADLYDDLEYDNTEQEIKTLEAKIAIKCKALEAIVGKD